MKLRTLFFSLSLAALTAQPVLAQNDESEIILPVEAQSCAMPVAPARIPDEASYDDLVTAKNNINDFQKSLTSYRECIDKAGQIEALTEGNQMALTSAFNHSVEMEERVAGAFNEAVRAYKARQATDE